MLEIIIDNEFDKFVNIYLETWNIYLKKMCQEYLVILKKIKSLYFMESKKPTYSYFLLVFIFSSI